MPKNVKGRNCHNALSYFQTSTTVWAETKYDGERAQIHVEIVKGNDGMVSSNIRIWSKSGRESTWDRLGVHGIVMDAFGLNHFGRRGKFDLPFSMMRVKKNIVLDAEMVAWYKDHVDGLYFFSSGLAGIMLTMNDRVLENSWSYRTDCFRSSW